jgi:pyruvate formate lyase activating enzyme
MRCGIVFDIREFTLHDGPGIRTTVFLKGCPLHCAWCHNPEGLRMLPQRLTSPSGGRLCGEWLTSRQLAGILNRQGAILRANEGGVTFSGGEPLFQASFLAEVIDQLEDLHVVLQTSGFGAEDQFRLLLSRVDLVYFDLKLMDPVSHRRYTGSDNAPILRNLRVLSGSGVSFVIRVPLIPGVTDTEANLSAIAETVSGLPGLLGVDLLPYNSAAGGKYRPLALPFDPPYDEKRLVNTSTAAFQTHHVEAAVL